tara:strand:+ start:424 stop:1527 length:1104 start_codon:yes stop_codon:yes gene_type:complete
MTNGGNTTSTWVWSASTREDNAPSHLSNNDGIANGADNSTYGYNGKDTFELLDFENTITVKYTPPVGSTVFIPDYTSYEYTITGLDNSNIIDTVTLSNDSINILLKTPVPPDPIPEDFERGVSFLKDFVPEFALPDGFSFDRYDSPSGFYEFGYNLLEAGGNFDYIVNQDRNYDINLTITVTISEQTPTPPPPPETPIETKSDTKTLKIKINRNFSSIRNQFIEGYLEEQIQRGDVEYITYEGQQFDTGEEYLQYLAQNLQRTKGVIMTLQSVSGNSINNNVFTMDKYIHSTDSNGDVYARTDSPYIPYTVVIDGETFYRIDIRLKNIVGVFQQGDIVRDINNLEYEVISVGVEQTFSDEIPFRLFY